MNTKIGTTVESLDAWFDACKVTGQAPTFSSEEERNKFIDGDRQKRISLDNKDVQAFFKELSEETKEANQNLDQVTAFYYDLESIIRHYDVGTACFLREDEEDACCGVNHQLYFEEILNPDAVGDHKSTYTFWRIGYCKIGGSWHLAALRYKINNVEGPKLEHESMGDPIRLTHAPREVRLSATHHVRDLLTLILKNVRYNKSLSESALERIGPMVTSMRVHYAEAIA